MYWKFEMLSAFVLTAPRTSRKAAYFKTVSHPYFSELSERFYEAGRKVVPIDTLYDELDELGLAAWIMDDGAADGRQLRINTQSFSFEEVRLLIDFLYARFGLQGTINLDKGMPRIRIGAVSMPRLRELVGPHFIPSMRYKLNEKNGSWEESTAGSLECRSVPD